MSLQDTSQPQRTNCDAENVDTAPVTPQRSRCAQFGGREDLAQVYWDARALIHKYDLLLLKQFSEEDGIKRLTICNLWRVERHADNRIRTYTFSLIDGQWHEVMSLEGWPEIPFCPIRTAGPPTFWRDVVYTALWKVLIAAGYNSLPKYQKKISDKRLAKYRERVESTHHFDPHSRRWYKRKSNRRPWNAPGNTVRTKRPSYLPPGVKAEMTPMKMAFRLIGRYIGRKVWKDHVETWRDGRLKSPVMATAARGIRAVIYDHFVDRDVMSAMLAIDYNRLPFLKYIQWHRDRRNHLLRVASERRNLLPLLAAIDAKQWARPDLFSRKIWVKGGRMSTVVDRGGFLAEQTGVFRVARASRSFDSKAGWKWLSSAPFNAVKTWCGEGGMNPAVATNIGIACSTIEQRIPVLALQHVIREPVYRHKGGLPRYGVSPVAQQLYRLFLLHSIEVWRTRGHAELKRWIANSGEASMGNMLDYLEAEGFEQGFPDRLATWASLLRRSEDWHRRVAIANMERAERHAQVATDDKGRIVALKWSSALPETQVDGTFLRPLISARELAIEGYELNHCIGQYTRMCQSGHYRAFSVLEEDGTRSTLGLVIRRKTVSIEQHRGKYNGPVSPVATSVGRQVAKLYQQALANKRGRRVDP